MGLASALSTALTGLTAAETTIDVVGNNLANSNTVGFKQSTATFATQFLQTQSLGSAPTVNSGGTNPRQIGLGTMVAEISPNFTQGTVEISANPTDLAIQGDGFFIVEGSPGEQFYSRNGVFKMNSESQLVSITGNRLLGFGVDDRFQVQTTTLQPIEIPLGSAAVALPTENVVLTGTLSPTGDVADTAEIIQTQILGDDAYSQPTWNDDPVSGSKLETSPAPTDGTTGVDFAAGNLAPGNYQYRVVFADSTATSPPLPDRSNAEGMPSGPTAVINIPPGPNRTIRLSKIPIDAVGGSEYDVRNIYRSSDGGVTYQYAGQIPMAAVTFDDDGTTTGADLNLDPPLDGSYSYHITFADAGGGYGSGTESRPTQPVAGPQTADGRIQLRNLPVDASGQWSVRRIYRTIDGVPGTFYYVGEIDDAITPGLTFTDHVTDADLLLAAETLDLDGPKISDSTLLTKVLRRDGANYDPVFEVGTLTFTGQKGGRTVASKELEITVTSTVQDLYNFMEDALGIREPPGPDPNHVIPDDAGSGEAPGGSVIDGQIRLIGNNGTGNALEIGLSDMQLTTATGTSNVDLPFNSTQSAIGESAVCDFIAYDSLGIALNVRLTAVLEDRDGTSTTFRWFADSPDNDPASGVEVAVGTGLITFDGEGNLINATEETVSIDRRNIPSTSPLEFELDFSQLSGLSGTQADDAGNTSTVAVQRQDGSAPGVLMSFLVGEDGRIRGVFSNGITRDIGQIRLARFVNPAGLEQKGENLFAAGINSGQPVAGNPGELGIGTLRAGAVELSNADIGSNLIDLILASTMYRGNARVITTAQQMLDELLSLRR